MEIKTVLYTLAVALAGGMTLAAVTHYRDETKDEPSVLEKVKEAERKLYEDGERQALALDKVKSDAELAAKSDYN